MTTLIVERGAKPETAVSGNRYPSGSPQNIASASSGNVVVASFFLEPKDYIGTKLRMRIAACVNDTAPAMNYTIGMYQVLSVAGAAAVVSMVTTTTAIPGSTLVLTAPAANSMTHSETNLFNWPGISGWYVFRIANTVTPTANAAVQINIQLEAI
jgi:hypothetical protein